MMFFQRILVADDVRAECSTATQSAPAKLEANPKAISEVETDCEERDLINVLEELQRAQKDLRPAAENPTTVKS